MQTPVPAQPAPDQPTNNDPLAGVAVSFTEVPAVKVAAQTCPQSIPAGELVTVPDPDPDFVTVSVCWTGATVSNVAVTAWSCVIDTLQAPVPEQPAPDQPANTDPGAPVAVSVTVVPCGYMAEQALGQEIPAGELATVPDPEPATDTVSACSESKMYAAPVKLLTPGAPSTATLPSDDSVIPAIPERAAFVSVAVGVDLEPHDASDGASKI